MVRYYKCLEDFDVYIDNSQLNKPNKLIKKFKKGDVHSSNNHNLFNEDYQHSFVEITESEYFKKNGCDD